MLSRIKLAWWRESLERLDREPPPPEPVLRALAETVLPRGIGGAELAAMEEGWAALLSAGPLEAFELDSYAAARGGLLFRLSARLLDGMGKATETAGEAWALVDLARRSGRRDEAEQALAAARTRLGPRRWPPALRPLGMLEALARRDAAAGAEAWEAQGSPRRMFRMMRHRLTGR
jgi:phytoene synthase